MSPKLLPLVLLVVLSPKTRATPSPFPSLPSRALQGAPSFPPSETEPTPWYRNEGKHSLIFNLTSDHSALGVTHTSRPCGGKPWVGGGRQGEGQRLRMGVEEIEIKDLGEQRG